MRARRILVPLAVIGLALGLWLWPGFGADPRPSFAGHVERCGANLRAIHAGLVELERRTGRAPQGAGVAFFAELIASGTWEDTAENRARLSCVGPDAEPVPDGVAYADLARLTGRDSAYAGRDAARFPLAEFPSGGAQPEPLLACDSSANHGGVINLLRSDGSVVTLTLESEIERGRLPAGATAIPVGAGSPIPELAKLSGD